jgi:hypothetical protein
MRNVVVPGACFIALLLCAGVEALAQGATPIAVQSAAAAGYSIAGTVVDATNGEPVQRATVAVLSEADRNAVASVVTDNEGRFTLEGLAAGKYPLTASKRGFRTAFFDEHDGGYNTAIVTGEGQQTRGLVFKLNRGAALQGVVIGDGGDPVEGAVMLFVKPHKHNPGTRITQIGEVSTDDTGAYEFDDLPAGEYLLAVKAEPWYALHHSHDSSRQQPESGANPALDVAYPITYFDSTADESAATPITLKAGSREEANINLRAVPALHIFVQVPLADEEKHELVPPPALQRTIFGTQIPSEASLNQNPKESDMAEFTGIAPGRYELQQGNPPRVAELDATTNERVDPSLGIPTVAVSGTLRATRGFVIPEDVTLALNSLDGTQGQASLQTSCYDGIFTFAAVPPGNWRLTILSPGKTLLVESISIGKKTNAGSLLTVKDKPLQTEVTVSAGETRVEGFAKKGGKGAAGVMVVLVPRDQAANGDQFRRDQSDSDGSFSLRDVAPGEYTVVAIADGWELDWERPEVLGPYLRKGIVVTVTESSGKLIAIKEGVPVQNR